MKIIAKPRGSGKTTDLVIISARTGDYIVSKNKLTVSLIMKIARDMGLYIPIPLTFDEFLEKRWRAKEISGFLIDDAEELLRRLIGLATPEIHVMTISEGDDKDE